MILLKEVWLNFRIFLSWFFARSKISNVNNIAIWKHLGLKFDREPFYRYSKPTCEFQLSMSRDNKVRVEKDHSKKFRCKLAASFSSIVHCVCTIWKLPNRWSVQSGSKRCGATNQGKNCVTLERSIDHTTILKQKSSNFVCGYFLIKESWQNGTFPRKESSLSEEKWNLKAIFMFPCHDQLINGSLRFPLILKEISIKKRTERMK